MKSYKDLIVWQKSFQLVLKIYKVTALFPKEETYGLVSQMRRAAIAIPSNIAEGHNRISIKEYIQFLSIAYSSGAEFETQLLLSKELKYLDKTNFEIIMNLLVEVLKMLNRLIKNLQLKSYSP